MERAVAEGLPLHLRTNVEVERLVLNGHGNAAGVGLLDRVTGQRNVSRAGRTCSPGEPSALRTSCCGRGRTDPWLAGIT